MSTRWVALAAVLVLPAAPALATTRTVCATGCTFTRIQNAINASNPAGGDIEQVDATYDSATSGEVLPIQTLALDPPLMAR